MILVGDIERGGVFAALYGTWALLTSEERALLRGFVINKLWGEKEVLKPGVKQLEQLTGVPVLGVLPYRRFLLDDEDSLNLKISGTKSPWRDVKIGVVALPHLANTSDFQPLSLESDVGISFVAPDEDLTPFDLLIIPGTKNTVEDLVFLHGCGFGQKLQEFLALGKAVLGICGGFQMLGLVVRDPQHCESSREEVPGLGILRMVTEFRPGKVLRRVRGVWSVNPEAQMEGYEIHQGRSDFLAQYPPFFLLDPDEKEGAVIGGQVFGTYCHGIFDQGTFRRSFLNFLRAKKGLSPVTVVSPSWKEQLLRELDSLTDFLALHLDFFALERILGA